MKLLKKGGRIDYETAAFVVERWYLLSCANEWSIFAWHEDLTNQDRIEMWELRKKALNGKDCPEKIVLKYVLEQTGRLLFA